MAIRKKLTEETPAPSPSFVPSEDPRFRVTRHVNVESWKWNDNETKYFRVLDRIHKGKTFADKDGKATAKYAEPADIMSVVDLGDGLMTQRVISLGKVLRENFEEQYPDGSYVGKCFAVTRLPKAPGKRYHLYRADEIEPND